MNPTKNTFKGATSLHKNFVEELSSDDDVPCDDNNEIKKKGNKYSRGILEIIKDDDEGEKIRTSSCDITINEEVYRFLRKIDLEFLIENFSGSHSKTTLLELKNMKDEELEELLDGPMYVKHIR